MIRIYVDAPLFAAGVITPSPEQSRYLTLVMRKVEGDAVLVFNGRDGEWRARISAVGKRGCQLSLEAQTRPQTPAPDLELVMALVKRGPLETVIEKATELGVRRIRLVTTRRTNADHTNVTRLIAIAIEAAEQCQRLDAPEILPPEKLERVLADWPADRPLLFADEATGEAPAMPFLTAMAAVQGDRAALLIGPEGGFDPVEQQALRCRAGVVPVRLGPRILRAETAAIAGLTLWQASRGDWR